MSKPLISWNCRCHSGCDVYWEVEITPHRVTLFERSCVVGSVTIPAAKRLLAGKNAHGLDGSGCKTELEPETVRGGMLRIGCQVIPDEIVRKIRKAI